MMPGRSIDQRREVAGVGDLDTRARTARHLEGADAVFVHLGRGGGRDEQGPGGELGRDVRRDAGDGTRPAPAPKLPA